jgi:hypothetical protein
MPGSQGAPAQAQSECRQRPARKQCDLSGSRMNIAMVPSRLAHAEPLVGRVAPLSVRHSAPTGAGGGRWRLPLTGWRHPAYS